MKGVLAFVLCLFVANRAQCEEEWEAWKTLHGKKYFNDTEEQTRHAIWRDNLRKIHQHNTEGHSFNLSLNHFSDLTFEEYRDSIVAPCFYSSNETERRGSAFLSSSKATLPDAVDWRKEGYVTGVKDQGDCGSCWAFSATGSLEGQHFKKTGQLLSLSEQNLVDCSGKYGNMGCKGGRIDNAFRYIIANGGIDTEASYSYKAKDGDCDFKKAHIGANVTSYAYIQQGSEADLQSAVAQVGPISVAIDASHDLFQHYSTGVYDEVHCSSTELDHAVLVVGYGTHKGKDYWLVKNSWGTRWGLKGYIMMSRNRDNQCGIATSALYPVAGDFYNPSALNPTTAPNHKDCIFPMVPFNFLTISFAMLYSQ